MITEISLQCGGSKPVACEEEPRPQGGDDGSDGDLD